MAIDVSYSEARASLASLWDQVTENKEEAILHRRGKEDVSLIPSSELRSLQETLHLLSSRANAVRLLTAIHRSEQGTVAPKTVEELSREVGFA